MDLWCSCFGRRSVVNSNPKSGYARIVEAKAPPTYSSLPVDVATVSSRRHSWDTDHANEAARLPSTQLTVIDEKELLESTIRSTAPSSRSSIISLPSTRVTAFTITTDNTGASHLSRRSYESEASRGAPPSYSSRRSASYRRSNHSSWDQHHPVLGEDWFDQFREP